MIDKISITKYIDIYNVSDLIFDKIYNLDSNLKIYVPILCVC